MNLPNPNPAERSEALEKDAPSLPPKPDDGPQ